MEITQDDWDRWKVDAVTKEVFKVLQERRDKIAHSVANGYCLGSIGSSPEYYGECVGRYREIDDLLNMEFKDMKEVE